MNAIHEHAQLSPSCDLGSQNYEQWVVQKERKGEHIYARLQGIVTLGPVSIFENNHVLQGYSNLSHSIIAATEEDQRVRVCAEHLRQYNEGLNLSNTIRMRDSFNFLNKYCKEEIKKKTTPDEEQVIQITDTERFLFNLFKGIDWFCYE